MRSPVTPTTEEIRRFGEHFDTIVANIERVVRGKHDVIRLVVGAMVSGGHALIEDVPGVGKTLLAKSLARSVDCPYQRIQFTPDLLPSDVTGVSIWDRDRNEFVFKPGPVFASVVLGDEINRASPKTQAALLEAMEERQVTIDGVTRRIDGPFMVIATQNPIEHEGTYPLPESQLDRFMFRVTVGYPAPADELDMLSTHGIVSGFDELTPVVHAADVVELIDIASRVHVSPAVQQYIVDLATATREHPEIVLGASPRAALFLQRAARTYAAAAGRDFAAPDDVKALLDPVLSHRLILSSDARTSGGSIPAVLADVANRVAVPGTRVRS
jgi:MoxR-like ATPase